MIKPSISAYLAPPTESWREPYPSLKPPSWRYAVDRNRTDDCAALLASSVWMIRVPSLPPEVVVREAVFRRPDLVEAFGYWQAMDISVYGSAGEGVGKVVLEEGRHPDREGGIATTVEIAPDEGVSLDRGEYAKAAEIRASVQRPSTLDSDVATAVAAAWRIRQALDGRPGETFVLLEGYDHREAFGPASRDGQVLYGGISKKVVYPFRLSEDHRLERIQVEPKGDYQSVEQLEKDVSFDGGRLVKSAFEAWYPGWKQALCVEGTIDGAGRVFLATVLLALAMEGRSCAIAEVRPRSASRSPGGLSRIVIDLRGVEDRPTASVALARATWHLPGSTLHIETCDPAAGRQTFVVLGGRVVGSFVEGSNRRKGSHRLDERVDVVGPDGAGSRADRHVSAALARFARSMAAEARFDRTSFVEIEIAMGRDGPVVVSLQDCRGAWPELPDEIVARAIKRTRGRALAACAGWIASVALKERRDRTATRSAIEREFEHPLVLERTMARVRHVERMSEFVGNIAIDTTGAEVEKPIVALPEDEGGTGMVAAVIERLLPEGRLAFVVHPCLRRGMRRTIAGVLVTDERDRSTLDFMDVAADETSVVVGDNPSVWPFPRKGRTTSGRPARLSDGLVVDLSDGFMLAVDPPRDGFLSVRVIRVPNGAERFEAVLSAPTTSSVEVPVGPMEERVGRLDPAYRGGGRRIVDSPTLDDGEDEDDVFGNDVVLRTLAALDGDGEDA